MHSITVVDFFNIIFRQWAIEWHGASTFFDEALQLEGDGRAVLERGDCGVEPVLQGELGNCRVGLLHISASIFSRFQHV